jgi:hypothetical protein
VLHINFCNLSHQQHNLTRMLHKTTLLDATASQHKIAVNCGACNTVASNIVKHGEYLVPERLQACATITTGGHPQPADMLVTIALLGPLASTASERECRPCSVCATDVY